MRLPLAFEAGLTRPDTVVVFRPQPDFDLGGPVKDLCVVHSFAPDVGFWAARGAQVVQTAQAADLAIVCAHKSKALTRAMIAQACQVAPIVCVDGQKTDGIESAYKAVRQKAEVFGTLTKAHGRAFWFKAQPFDDWRDAPTDIGPFRTWPGVFSEGRIDRASIALALSLPPKLPARMADFGAGWGYLSAAICERDGVQSLDMVEAEKRALDEAARVISFGAPVWADITQHQATYDGIVMNPPFHTGRAGDPGLGQAFIAAAARCLTPKGQLWMVANRHLPYEDTLATQFGQVTELPAPPGAGDGAGAFKLLHAARPRR